MGIHNTNMGLRGRTITWKHNGGFCLNLHNDQQENGGVINLWEKNRHQSQRWMIIPVSRCGEVFRVHYAANPKFVLNLHNNEHSNGASSEATINLHCNNHANEGIINLWEAND